jgi:UDP-glucose 4-epimerase
LHYFFGEIMRILITGGAGYIGSHAVRETIDQGHQVWVLDDLSNGHKSAVHSKAQLVIGSTGDYDLVFKILKSHKIEAVMHFAANIEVAESVAKPKKYYDNNFNNGLQLLNAMCDAGVQRLVFSSTAAVYGISDKISLDENLPLSPINPYGRSKMMMEMAIQDYSKAYGLGFTILRYFNVAGAHPDGTIGEDHHPETHLIPRVLAAAGGVMAHVKIFGTDYPTKDGTCLRDYVHVVDLVKAHVLAIAAISPGTGEIFNLGSEKGFSVREIIKTCEEVTRTELSVLEESRRMGDPASLVASSQKIRKALNWQPLYPDIQSIVAHAWNWHFRNPKGYAKEKV